MNHAIDTAFRLSAIVEFSEDAIISKDLDGVINTWNNGAERIFGYREDEAVGRPVSILIPPDRADEERHILEQIGKGERIEHYETVRQRKDGSYVDISLTVSPIRNASGTIVGASKIARDISRQRRDREQLHRNEELMRVTLLSIGDAVISTERAGRVTHMNSVAEDLTGWKQHEAIGDPLEKSFRIINEFSREPVENPVARVLRTGAVVGLANHTLLVSKDGTERPIDDSAAPIRNASGDVLGVVLVFRDVTERRARETATQRLGTIVENSHDAIYSVSFANDSGTLGIVEHWNRAAESLYGYTAQEIIGEPLSMLVPPELMEEERDVIARISKGERVDAYETRRLTKDGRHVDVSLTASPLTDDAGRIVGVSKIARDITARKRAEAALRESEALKTGILDAALDAIITIDQSTEVLEFNPAAERIFGYTRHDAIGRRIGDLIIPPALRDAHNRGVTRYLTTGESHVLGRRVEMTAMRSDGSEFPCELAINRVPLHAQVLFTASVRDVTERKQAEEALRESEEQLRTLADNIPQLAWMADEKGWIYWYNKRWYEYTGTTLEDMQGWGWTKVHHADHVDHVVERIQTSLDTGEPWEDSFPLRDKDGNYRWFLSRALPIRNRAGQVVRWLGTSTDVTEQRAAEETLRHGALHDALTDLPNRAYFLARASEALGRLQRDSERRVAILLLDFDGFKAVNDTLGHAAGDRLLMEIAQRLRTCVRPSDIVARLGGDEFTVLLDDVTGVADVERAALRIQDALAAPLVLESREVVPTASIGAALSEPDDPNPQDLLRDADLAMYHAKQQGGARLQVFDVALRDSAQARFGMQTDLRNAVDRHELQLAFQPIVDLDTRRVYAFEALLRWHHPDRGLILPLEFIPLAEQTGFIMPIGAWALHEGCRHARHWQDAYPAAGPVKICVNVSGKQLGHAGFVQEVETALRDAGLPGSALILEVTESVLMENIESATALLHQLRELGVELYMDDFGTGYSSLSQLPRFPLRGIKVDRSFVHRMGARRTDLEIVRSIVDMARTLGLRVVAEGVDTVVQRERLIAFGCELGQGYLFAKALDAAAADAFLLQAVMPGRQIA